MENECETCWYYDYDEETGLYYLQSRYYNPTWCRFLNADAFVSTGQGVLGNNMFAYCLNNPANLLDPFGTIPFVDHPFTNAAIEIGEQIGWWLKDYFDKKREESKEIPYQSNGAGNGAQIPNSHTIKDPVIMYEYIEENRGDEITGSTTGVVFEWIVHNAVYTTGKVFSAVGFKKWGKTLVEKGQYLDVGQTIYDDSHRLASVVMWSTYRSLFPVVSIYDLIIELRDKG